MDKNNNEIKFVKNRSNCTEEVLKDFQKGNYYDAFYKLKRLNKDERTKFLPSVAEVYARLRKADYEASALLKLITGCEELLNDNGVDKQMIAMRLSSYYSYKGEKVNRLSIKPRKKMKDNRVVDVNELSSDIIKFPKQPKYESDKSEASNVCKIYRKRSVSVDAGDYLCDRATEVAVSGKYEDALQILEKVNKNSQKYYESLKLKTAILLDSQKFSEAVDVSMYILKENPDEFIALFALNLAISMNVKVDEITQMLIMLNGGTSLQNVMLRAQAFGATEKFSEAINILESLNSEDKYAEDALKLKAVFYSKLGDKQGEEEALKRLVTLYPKDLKARFILSSLHKESGISSEMINSSDITKMLVADLETFMCTKLEQITTLTEEEADYYYNLCVTYGNKSMLEKCTDEFLRHKRFVEIVTDRLIELNLDDIKKTTIVERLILARLSGDVYSLINGMVKKLNLSSLAILLEEVNERGLNNLHAFSDLGAKKIVEEGYSKAFAVSVLLDIDGIAVLEKFIALAVLLSSSGNKLNEVLDTSSKIALSSCILVNFQAVKNAKAKKYLGLKNQDIDDIIKELKELGLFD